MRCSALWHEIWYIALTEASKLHFEEDDTAGTTLTLVEHGKRGTILSLAWPSHSQYSRPSNAFLLAGMLTKLQEAHALTREPQTPHEAAIFNAFQADLVEAERWLNRYVATQSTDDLNSAWSVPAGV